MGRPLFVWDAEIVGTRRCARNGMPVRPRDVVMFGVALCARDSVRLGARRALSDSHLAKSRVTAGTCANARTHCCFFCGMTSPVGALSERPQPGPMDALRAYARAPLPGTRHHMNAPARPEWHINRLDLRIVRNGITAR